MATPTLANRFPTFNVFWEEFKGYVVSDYRPEGRINNIFISNNIYNYFRNWPFWEDEDDAIYSFMTELSFLCAEVQQKDIIHDKIYSRIKEFLTIRTETRRVVRTNESKGREVISYDVPLESPDMTQVSFGQHGKADWLQSIQRSKQAPEVQINEGLIAIDEKGEKIINPNWVETQDPAAVARLVNSFPNIEINFKQFLPRFYKIFQSYFSPAGDFVYDEKSRERKWRSRTEIIQEEEEEEIKPIIKVEEDDITEKEYLRLKKENPNQVAENWQVERLTRRKKFLEKQAKRTSGSFKDKIMLRLMFCETFIETFKKTPQMPPVGTPDEKLPVTAELEEWDKATFWARINQTIGYGEFKEAFADFIEGYNDLVTDNIDRPSQMFLLLGPPGVGKTFMATMIARASDRPIEEISLNGKKEPSVFFGIPQEYSGAGVGEILKTISRYKTTSPVIVFDEIDKCDRQVQRVLGNITDKTLNKKFKDVFFDYSLPINELIIFCTANSPQEIEPFLYSRLTPIQVQPPTFAQRLEIIDDFISLEFKKYKVTNLKTKISDTLIKKFITWEWGMRGAKDNVERTAYRVYLLNKKNKLPTDWDEYGWPIFQKIELDAGDKEINRPACPVYADHTTQHREGCQCFKPEKIEGWIEEMGSEYPD